MRIPALPPTIIAALIYLPLLTLADSRKALTTPWEQIHQTINTYPLAVDFKSGPAFASVFHPDATANYTGPLSNLVGLPAIRDALLDSVSTVVSQHQLGTTIISIGEDEMSANSTTYFTAMLRSVAPEMVGDYTILYGLYNDQLVDMEDVGWRIIRRELVFMAPSLGNLTLG